MLSKIFKKNESTDSTPASPPGGKPTAQKGVAKGVAPEIAMEWRSKFQRAVGDDAALLALATETPLLDIKQAAVQAMHSEETLRAAEKEFRTHDRRVHRLAKQRYEHAVAQRVARASAEGLISAASAALQDESIPANRLVELDRAWQALDHALLTTDEITRYEAHWQQLITQTRGRGDQHLLVSRWTQLAERHLRDAGKAITEVRGGTQPQTELAARAAQLQETLSARPLIEDVGAADLQAMAEQFVAELQATLARLADVDAEISRDVARKADQAKLIEAREQEKSSTNAAHAAAVEVVTKEVVLAETSLSEGHLNETSTHLVALEQLQEKTKRLPAALLKRIETVQVEYARLKGWQHWGGGRARDDLVAEAEALAAQASEVKLALKPHAESIEKLRERWKELDKLGGATSRALWLRFDTSLKAAYGPVAAQLAKLKAARQDNLSARNQLIVELDKVVLVTSADGALTSGADEKSTVTPDWREIARALEHFRSEWRKLGPIEHTVPHKSRDALLKRMEERVARLEGPLTEARRVAQLAREKLIARATALGADAKQRETINKVRDLQAEWQAQAKSLPLARNVENALWTSFKTATDAVFQLRDAAQAAREGAWNEQRQARETLIGRLQALTEDSPASEVKKTLQDVDQAWRKAGEVARKDAPTLDARYRDARDAAQKRLSSSATRAWSKVVEALAAKCSLCDEIEAGNAENVASRWNELLALPAAWEQALQARRLGKSSPMPSKYDASLLRAESALDIETPSAFQASRRDLKLLAMKAAMEGRQQRVGGDEELRGLIAELVGQAPHDATARTRFLAIMEGLKQRALAG